MFYYTPPDGEAEEKAGNERPSCRIAAWPLPDALAQGWHEEQGEDILGLVEKAGQKLVLEKAARDAAGAAALPLSRRLRKLEQLLAKLDEEEQRLLGMCAAREDGLLLQAWLWRWPADFRAPELVLPPPEEGDGDTPRKTVKLDMRRSVRDNMERLFHTARRGQRGLEHLAERRAVLRAELATVQAARQEALLGGIGHAAGEAGKPDRNTVALGALRGAALPRNVQLFVSDDGFALLRGRDAKGNIAARKLAAAHDIWLAYRRRPRLARHHPPGPCRTGSAGAHPGPGRGAGGLQELAEGRGPGAHPLRRGAPHPQHARRGHRHRAHGQDPLQPRGAGGCQSGDPSAAGKPCGEDGRDGQGLSSAVRLLRPMGVPFVLFG